MTLNTAHVQNFFSHHALSCEAHVGSTHMSRGALVMVHVHITLQLCIRRRTA